jgi:hypothetical protein
VSGGTFSSTLIEIIKWVKKFAVAQEEVTHILRTGKALEKTPKGVIPPSQCEISHNASRKKMLLPVVPLNLSGHYALMLGLMTAHEPVAD